MRRRLPHLEVFRGGEATGFGRLARRFWLLIDLQVTAGVGEGGRASARLSFLSHSPPLIFASTPPSPGHFLNSRLCQIISHLLPPSIDSTSLSLSLSFSVLPIIILFLHPFHPFSGDSWFLHRSLSLLPSNSATPFPLCWEPTVLCYDGAVRFTPPT